MISRRSALLGMGAGLVAPWIAGRAVAADGPLVVPIAIQGPRILVAVGIDGQGPFFFLIDTGGTLSLIDNALARQLKLPVVSGHLIRGGNGKSTSSALYRAREVSIGNVVRDGNLAFNGVDGFGFGEDIRGTLAAGALTAYDSVLDLDRGEWRIYRNGLPDLPGFTPIESDVGHPTRHGSAYMYATASLDGQSYRFLLDTGAPAGVRLYPEAVRRSSLWGKGSYAPVRSSGVGGRGAIDRIVRAGALNLGGIAFDRPLVHLDGGGRGQRVADGVIGFAVLRQLNIATDVRHGRLLIERNRLKPPPERASTSGLWIDQRGDTLVVADVGRGSPAAAAGIVPGDIIAGHRLGEVVHALGSGAGATVGLTIEHDGTPRRVSIALADYL